MKEQALQAARMIALALVVAPLGLLALALFFSGIEVAPAVARLVAPVALIGAINPLIVFRLYQARREQLPQEASAEERLRRFVTSTLLAMAISEGIGLLSVVFYWLTSAPVVLIGVATHLIVAGAVWPTPERLDRFLDGRVPRGDGGAA